VDASKLDHLVPLRHGVRGADIRRSTLYGETAAVRAAAAAGRMERHAGRLQHCWCCQDHPRASAYSQVARLRRVCMQVTHLVHLLSYQLSH